jgi:hypothetical protein
MNKMSEKNAQSWFVIFFYFFYEEVKKFTSMDNKRREGRQQMTEYGIRRKILIPT